MSYEVEQKFPVDSFESIETALAEMGADIQPPQVEHDLYFEHPARAFRQTDEALRVRRRGSANRITYKGPKIDQTTKTRREIELPLPDGEGVADRWREMLEALGFTPIGQVSKRRRKVRIAWEGWDIEGSLDEVGLPAAERDAGGCPSDRSHRPRHDWLLGVFVELEVVAEEEHLDAARASIASLAKHLGLERSERRSYLTLLLDQQRSAT